MIGSVREWYVSDIFYDVFQREKKGFHTSTKLSSVAREQNSGITSSSLGSFGCFSGREELDSNQLAGAAGPGGGRGTPEFGGGRRVPG